MPQHKDKPTAMNGAKERRNMSLPIRWKASEIEKIKLLAKSVNTDVSEFVRASSLNKQPKPGGKATGERLELIKALGELGKIGSNVNQVAKALNQGHPMATASIIRAMQAVEQCADNIRFILQNPSI